LEIGGGRGGFGFVGEGKVIRLRGFLVKFGPLEEVTVHE
jgi:hypothetical protein